MTTLEASTFQFPSEIAVYQFLIKCDDTKKMDPVLLQKIADVFANQVVQEFSLLDQFSLRILDEINIKLALKKCAYNASSCSSFSSNSYLKYFLPLSSSSSLNSSGASTSSTSSSLSSSLSSSPTSRTTISSAIPFWYSGNGFLVSEVYYTKPTPSDSLLKSKGDLL